MTVEEQPQGTGINEYSGDFVDRATSALEKIRTSEGFSASPRLQQFLSYVVEETLAGRGERIRGKAVAFQVYGRNLDSDTGGQNLVRVEAQRLRRLLEEYYENEGAEDAIRIHVPVGGYKPTITERERPKPAVVEVESTGAPSHTIWPRKRFVIVGAGVMALILCAVFFIGWERRPVPAANAPADIAQKAALRQQSVPRLQAANLAEQARGMFFPVYEAKRQALAYDMFLHAIELDPSLSDGHAGAAQAMATMAILSPDPQSRAERLELAQGHAEQALALSTADAWAIGSAAWVRAAARDWDAAKELASTAADLAPKDGHVLDLAGLSFMLAGEHVLAAEMSNPERERQGSGRFGARNIWGVSQLALGNYRAVVDAFEGAAASGDPISPPSLALQAVAHDKLGEPEEARKLVAELRETWPAFPAEFLVAQLFPTSPNLQDDILETLAKFGVQAREPGSNGN